MPAPSETEIVDFQGWTLRVRPAAIRPARLLLLIHGWTGDEDSMWVFARAIPEDYWAVAPRAPHGTRPSGYSWRVPPPDRSEDSSLSELLSPAAALLGLVDAYCKSQEKTCEVFDMIGFSQGAALASVLALMHPERVSRVALLSGFVPRGAESLASGHPLEGVRFFVAHGSEDELVSIEHARQSVQLLEAAGATVSVCEDDVGHKVSARCMRGLQAFLLG